MDKIITSLVNTYERLSSCCKKKPTIRWHSSVIDNEGKTTREYRENPKNPKTNIMPTKTEKEDDTKKRMQQLIAMQNHIHKQNNST